MVGLGAQPVLFKNKGDLNSFDPETRQNAINLVKGANDQAYELGATKVGFLSGPNTEKDVDKALQLLSDSIIDLSNYAKRKGNIALSLETFDDETDKKCLIGSNKLAAEVAKEVRKVDPTFGLMLDLSHLPCKEKPLKTH